MAAKSQLGYLLAGPRPHFYCDTMQSSRHSSRSPILSIMNYRPNGANGFAALLMLCLVGLATISLAGRVPTQVKLTHAKVFLSGATLSSSGSVKLPKGTHVVLVTKLPNSLDYNSVEVKGRGNAIVLGFRPSYAPPPPRPKPINKLKGRELLIAQLQDSIEILNLKQTELTDLSTEATAQMNSLREQQKAIRPQANAADQKILMDYLETKLNAHRQNLFKYRWTARGYSKLLAAKQAYLQYLLNGGDPGQYGKPAPDETTEPTEPVDPGESPDTLQWNGPLNNQLEVQVAMLEAGQFDFDLRYNVTSANWTPMYDIKVNPGKGPVKIQYRALVTQQTGLNWRGVNLTLSTTTPSTNRVVPTLNPYTIQLLDPQAYRPRPTAKYRRVAGAPVVNSVQEEAREDMAVETKSVAIAATTADYTQTSETLISTEYEISLPYTVPSNPQGQRIDIKNLEAQARYEHAAVPRLDPAAYLVAYIKGWESYSLIPGEAKIYLDDSYVGESYMQFDSPDEEMQLSLARDPAISIKRENKSIKKRGPSSLESSAVKPYHWEITVRNNRKDQTEIVLKDLVPLSGHEQLKVEEVKLDGGEKDEETNIVTWKLKLKPGETKKITLKYQLLYPKKMQLQE